jgi:hypothetical protein
MIDKFEDGWYYEPEEVEAQFTDLQIIYRIGEEPWAVYLVYIPSKNTYLEKFLEGRSGATTYRLCGVNDSISAQRWRKNTILEWNKNNPNKIIKED